MTAEHQGQELSLRQIEGDDWGEPPPEATMLMKTVLHLRRKPVGALDSEDLRFLIGQGIGLDELVPGALAHLRDHCDDSR